MILSGSTIEQRHIIHPHLPRTEMHTPDGRRLTYGESFAGYDVRVRERVRVWRFLTVLASTIEHFRVPLDVTGTDTGKSSLARRGISTIVTPLEPGWRGYLTLEIQFKPTWREWWKLWTVIDAGSPITQIQFSQVDAKTVGYAGPYQDQPARPVEAA